MADNPAAFAEAYWAVNSLKVYSATGSTDQAAASGSTGQGASGSAESAGSTGPTARRSLQGEELHRAGGKRVVHIHREEPKRINTDGPCSTAVDITEMTTVADVLALVSSRLGFPADRLEADSKEVHTPRNH